MIDTLFHTGSVLSPRTLRSLSTSPASLADVGVADLHASPVESLPVVRAPMAWVGGVERSRAILGACRAEVERASQPMHEFVLAVDVDGGHRGGGITHGFLVSWDGTLRVSELERSDAERLVRC